MLDYLVKLINL